MVLGRHRKRCVVQKISLGNKSCILSQGIFQFSFRVRIFDINKVTGVVPSGGGQDGQTDGQTDRQTDRQTQSHLNSRALSRRARLKNNRHLTSMKSQEQMTPEPMPSNIYPRRRGGGGHLHFSKNGVGFFEVKSEYHRRGGGGGGVTSFLRK